MSGGDTLSAGTTSGGIIKFGTKPDYKCDVARYQSAIDALGYAEASVGAGVEPMEAITRWKRVYERLKTKAEDNLKKERAEGEQEKFEEANFDAYQRGYEAGRKQAESLLKAAEWVSRCWRGDDQNWYRPDMDEAMRGLNFAIDEAQRDDQ